MNLFIPELGTKIQLTKSWTFTLYAERRNLSLFQLNSDKSCNLQKRKELREKLKNIRNLMDIELKIKNSYSLNDSKHYKEYNEIQEKYWATYNYRQIQKFSDITFVIPKNTVLEIDRIYIRTGNVDFSSVTFKWVKNNRTIRFWAKLEDVNKITFSLNKNISDYPDGRFTLMTTESFKSVYFNGFPRCTCGKVWYDCICNKSSWPDHKFNALYWTKNHKKHNYDIGSQHFISSEGINEIDSQNREHRRYTTEFKYKKHFNSLKSLIEWAESKNFDKKHIDKFIKKYQNAN